MPAETTVSGAHPAAKLPIYILPCFLWIGIVPFTFALKLKPSPDFYHDAAAAAGLIVLLFLTAGKKLFDVKIPAIRYETAVERVANGGFTDLPRQIEWNKALAAMWGILASAYLNGQRKIPAALGVICLIMQTAVLGLVNSRTILTYIAAIALILPFWYFRSDKSNRRTIFGQERIVTLFAWSLLIGSLLQSCIVVIQFAGWEDTPLFQNIIVYSGQGVIGHIGQRNNLGHYLFQSAPIFGHGWNSFAQQTFLINAEQHNIYDNLLSNLFTHSHNIVLQLLAEMGISGTLLVAATLLTGIAGLLKRPLTPASLFLICTLAVSMCHSMLEYPLWYVYFLIPFGLMLFLSPAEASDGARHSRSRIPYRAVPIFHEHHSGNLYRHQLPSVCNGGVLVSSGTPDEPDLPRYERHRLLDFHLARRQRVGLPELGRTIAFKKAANLGILTASAAIFAGLLHLDWTYTRLVNAFSPATDDSAKTLNRKINELRYISANSPMLSFYADFSLVNFALPEYPETQTWAEEATLKSLKYRPHSATYRIALYLMRQGKVAEAKQWMRATQSYYPYLMPRYADEIRKLPVWAPLLPELLKDCKAFAAAPGHPEAKPCK